MSLVPKFFIMAAIVLVVLALLGSAGTVTVANPPPPTPNKIGGVDIDKAVSEAKDLIPNLTPGDSFAGYIKSTGGSLRVMLDLNGDLLIVGQGTSANLALAAEAIATAIGATVGW